METQSLHRSRRRYDCHLNAYLEQQGEQIQGTVLNVSEFGIFLHTAQILEPGKQVLVKCDLDARTRVTVQGQVRWRCDGSQGPKQPGVGIRITVAPQMYLTFVHRLHNSVAPEAPAPLPVAPAVQISRIIPLTGRSKGIPNTGSLAEFLVAEVLLAHTEKGSTGILQLTQGGVQKDFYLRRGQVMFVDSSMHSERLGQFLVRNGDISAVNFDLALQEMAGSELKFGEILIQRGLITGAELSERLIAHQEEKLTSSFAWLSGYFHFESDTPWPDHIAAFPLRTHLAIFEGLNRWYETADLRRWMPFDENTSFLTQQHPSANVALPPKLTRLLNALQSAETLAQAAEKTHLSHQEILPYLFGAILAGWVHGGTAAPKTAKPFVVPTKKSPTTRDARGTTPPASGQKPVNGFVERIQQDFERLSRLNFYDLLGLTPTSEISSLEQRFHFLVQRYPQSQLDLLTDKKIRDQALQIISWYHLAYETLRDPKLREVYARRGRSKVSLERSGQRCEADRALMRALRLMDEKNLAAAANVLAEATHKIPGEPLLNAYLGWALFSLDPDANLTRATELIETALEREKSEPQLYYFLGKIYSHLGNWARAERYFTVAVKLQPNFVKAAAEQERARDKRIHLERLSREKDDKKS